MITIIALGVDPFILRQVSKDVTPKLASIYECDKDEISFFAPDGLLVHDGVEQNTWNAFIKVIAPKKVSVLEELATKVIVQYFQDVSVHLEIVYEYFSEDNYHVFIREDHPRFMTEENSYYEYEDEECDDEECEHHEHEHHHHHEEDEEVYLGDIFEDFNKQVEEEEKKKKS